MKKIPAMNPYIKRDVLSVILVTALTVLTSLVAVSFKSTYGWDETGYLWMAKSLSAGQGPLSLIHQPLFPFVLSVFYSLTRSLPITIKLYYLIFRTLVLLPLGLLAFFVYEKHTALITLLLLSAYPVFSSILFWGSMTELIFIFLIYSAILALERGVANNNSLLFALSSMLFGIAYLTRPEAIGWFVLQLVILIYILTKLTKSINKHFVVKLLSFCLPLLLCIGLYSMYFYAKTGHIAISGEGSDTLNFQEFKIDPAEYKSEQWEHRLSEENSNQESSHETRRPETDLASLLRRIKWNIIFFIRSINSVVPPFFWILVFLGILRSIRLRPIAPGTLILLGTIPTYLTYLIFYVEPRFLSLNVPTLLIFASVGLSSIYTFIPQIFRRAISSKYKIFNGNRLFIKRAAIIMTLVSLVVIFCNTISDHKESPAHKDLRKWLNHNTPRNSLLMSREPGLSLSVDRGFTEMPYANYNQFIKYAGKIGADYVIIDELHFTANNRKNVLLHPNLRFLIRKGVSTKDLDQVFYTSSGGRRIIVYKIKGGH